MVVIFLCLKLAASVEVAFGPGGDSTPYLRTDGVSKGINSGSASKFFSYKQNGSTPSLTATEDQSDTCMIDATDDTTDASARKTKKEYKEPWVRNCLHSSIFLYVSSSYI